MPFLHPRILLDLSLVWEGDTARGHYASSSTCLGYFFMVPPCHSYPPKNLFFTGAVICVGKRVMVRLDPVFCFDLARVFFQGATMPSLHPRIFIFLSVCSVGNRDSPMEICFELARVFQDATMPLLHPKFFNFWICQ